MKLITLLMVLLSASLLCGCAATGGLSPQTQTVLGTSTTIAGTIANIANEVHTVATTVQQAAQQTQAASTTTAQSADRVTSTLQTIQSVANAANGQNVPYAGLVAGVVGVGLAIYSAINKQTAVKQALATPAPAQVVAGPPTIIGAEPILQPLRTIETTQVTPTK